MYSNYMHLLFICLFEAIVKTNCQVLTNDQSSSDSAGALDKPSSEWAKTRDNEFRNSVLDFSDNLKSMRNALSDNSNSRENAALNIGLAEPSSESAETRQNKFPNLVLDFSDSQYRPDDSEPGLPDFVPRPPSILDRHRVELTDYWDRHPYLNRDNVELTDYSDRHPYLNRDNVSETPRLLARKMGSIKKVYKTKEVLEAMLWRRGQRIVTSVGFRGISGDTSSNDEGDSPVPTRKNHGALPVPTRNGKSASPVLIRNEKRVSKFPTLNDESPSRIPTQYYYLELPDGRFTNDPSCGGGVVSEVPTQIGDEEVVPEAPTHSRWNVSPAKRRSEYGENDYFHLPLLDERSSNDA